MLKTTFLFIVFSFLFIPLAKASCGKFVVVKGDVQIDILKTKKTEKAKVNSEICAGDSVTAASESRAKIVMVDGNELNISPDTKMKIEGYEYAPEQEKKKVLLNILFGKVRANVKQKYDDKSKDSASNSFQVQTKSAVAGVRGTDFLTSFTPATGKSEVVTFSGKVEVGQMGPGGAIINSVSVSAGQKTFAAPNQAPAPPRAVPSLELKQLNNSSSAANTQPSGNSTAASGAVKSGDKSASSTSSGSGDRAPASTGAQSIGASMTDPSTLQGQPEPNQQAAPKFSGPSLPPLPFGPAAAPIIQQIPDVRSIIQASGPAALNIAIIPHK